MTYILRFYLLGRPHLVCNDSTCALIETPILSDLPIRLLTRLTIRASTTARDMFALLPPVGLLFAFGPVRRRKNGSRP